MIVESVGRPWSGSGDTYQTKSNSFILMISTHKFIRNVEHVATGHKIAWAPFHKRVTINRIRKIDINHRSMAYRLLRNIEINRSPL